MPKKRSKPRKHHQPRTQQGRRRERLASVDRIDAVRQLGLLHTEFEAWVLEATPALAPEDAHQIFSSVALAVTMAVDAIGLRDVAAWAPSQLRDLLALAATIDAEEPGDDAFEDEPPLASTIAAVMGPFVDFLVDTGRWAGYEHDLPGIRELLAEAERRTAVTASQDGEVVLGRTDHGRQGQPRVEGDEPPPACDGQGEQ